ncbi:NADH-quinone oxidoreductase subunit K [Hoyosella altamirensis]|uniref:Multicomponent Na+:H+ antiporter subunit C n=1 Tax=Hoyosella altamirensis TaxID=616997 RepID=A0A839RRZ1_9ACTN|nr:NADH-quinone oxidoreductase subunit K [Hoyosella altamirensis]MBB3038641.1 multicomponent Na+:H+ antiporter subunit C [Hoyosella altamirensis]
MSRAELFIIVGVALFVFGAARMLLTADLIRRVVALNVAGAGVFLILMSLATVRDASEPDPVLHALVLTGIVITVSITGFALALIRRIERTEAVRNSPRESDG